MSGRAGSSPRVLIGFDFFAKYATGLALGLRQAGWEPMVLRRDHDLEFGGVPGDQGAYIREHLGPTVTSAVVPGRVRNVAALPELRRLRRAVGDFAPDVVHVQAAVGNDPRLPLVAGARPGRYAYTCHDPTVHPGDDPLSISQRLCERAVVTGAGLIFVHAEVLEEELRSHYRVRAPVVILPHGAEVTPCPGPGDPRTVLFFGRVSYYKGVDVLLDAMQLVWEQLPDARLVAAGQGDWPEHPALADPRVEARTEHVPEQEVRDLFCRAGCVVLPYRQASQSGVGSLARQFGRALVVTSAGGLPELVSDSTGRVVRPGSPRELADALLRLMQAPGTLEEMGRAASRELDATASWRRVGELTAEAYERHLLRPAATPAKSHVVAPATDRVEVVEGLDLPATVVDEWRALAELRENLFVSPEWCAAWAAARASDRPLILLWWSAGVLRGVLPLVRARRGPLRVLRFPGADRGDWFGPACRPEDEREMAGACAETLLDLQDDWHVLELTRVDAESAWPAALAPRAGRSPLALVTTRDDDVLPYVSFGDAGWDAYLATRSRNFRSQLGRRERRLGREHRLEFRLTERAGELAEDMRWLRTLHDARWAARGGSGWTADVWEAHGHFAQAALERGWLRLWNVEIDGERAAAWYGWRVGARYCYSLSGFDPSHEDEALGVVVLAHTMREGVAEGASVYDMMWGDEPYKRRFETGRRAAVSCAVARRGHPARWLVASSAAAMSRARRLPPRVQRPLKRAYQRLGRLL